MSDATDNDPFFSNYEKAVLYVTTDDNPTDVRVYFAPVKPGMQDSQGALSLIPKSQKKDQDEARSEEQEEQEEQDRGLEIYDSVSDKAGYYPSIIVSDKGGGDFKEFDLLKKLEKSGDINHIHAANFEAAWPRVEEALKQRLRLEGWEDKHIALSVDARTDHRLETSDGFKLESYMKPLNQLAPLPEDVKEAQRLALKMTGKTYDPEKEPEKAKQESMARGN